MGLKELLGRLGQRIRTRRKLLKISAVAASEAAGISRMTLNRIESGYSRSGAATLVEVLLSP